MNDAINTAISDSINDTTCPTRDTLAMRAHRKSITFSGLGDKDAWLALFDDNAVVHDPVGKSGHDPSGEGFRGKQRLSEFWDVMIGPGNLLVVPQKRIPVGEHIACVNMTAVMHIHGVKSYVEMVAIYEVNDDGKLISLKVYWDTNAASEMLPLS